MELKQELKLKQTLSQKMIQSANILQMGQIELKEYIEEMALENPVVDLEEREPENGRLEENGELNEKIRRLEELASLDRQNQTYYQDEEEEAGRLESGWAFGIASGTGVYAASDEKRRKNIPLYDQKSGCKRISQREFWRTLRWAGN